MHLLFLCCLCLLSVTEFICDKNKENWEPAGDEGMCYMDQMLNCHRKVLLIHVKMLTFLKVMKVSIIL